MSEAGPQSPHLQEEERRQAAEFAPLGAPVIHEIIRDEGQSELKRPADAMAWSGLAGGLSMGFSFLTQALLRSGLPDAPWRELVSSFGYTIGFVIVVLGRQQLFTESTLSAVLPVLTKRDGDSVAATARLWSVVLVSNLVGTWLFATLLAFGRLVRPEVEPSLSALAAESVAHPFWPTLVRATVAGWLIALMVWLLPSARSARLFVIILITYVVALAKLSHIIAGSSEAAYGVLTGTASGGDYVFRFLIPTLLGNILGGVGLVAMLNHAPIAHQLEGSEEG